jgi:hypothetical protein
MEVCTPRPPPMWCAWRACASAAQRLSVRIAKIWGTVRVRRRETVPPRTKALGGMVCFFERAVPPVPGFTYPAFFPARPLFARADRAFVPARKAVLQSHWLTVDPHAPGVMFPRQSRLADSHRPQKRVPPQNHRADSPCRPRSRFSSQCRLADSRCPRKRVRRQSPRADSPCYP